MTNQYRPIPESNLLVAYREAFGRCYPQHQLQFRPYQRNGESRTWVIINRERGDTPLTDNDLRHAIAGFSKGYSDANRSHSGE